MKTISIRCVGCGALKDFEGQTYGRALADIDGSEWRVELDNAKAPNLRGIINAPGICPECQRKAEEGEPEVDE